MSLDIYLYKKKYVSYDKGATYTEEDEQVYWSNITHNLGLMASKSGLYEALWRPYKLLPNYVDTDDNNVEYEFEENNIVYGKDIIDILESGYEELKNNKEHYLQFNPANGWGSYDGLLEFTEEYIKAIKENPDTFIKTSR